VVVTAGTMWVKHIVRGGLMMREKSREQVNLAKETVGENV
jgi:hypothetical protein